MVSPWAVAASWPWPATSFWLPVLTPRARVAPSSVSPRWAWVSLPLLRHPASAPSGGIAKAKELIFSGKTIGAAEAKEIGLVNAVYPPEELMNGAIAMAKSFTANAPIAVKYAKACIDRGMQMDIDDGIALENELFAMCFATADQKEGMGAFLEKRKEKHFQNK